MLRSVLLVQVRHLRPERHILEFKVAGLVIMPALLRRRDERFLKYVVVFGRSRLGPDSVSQEHRQANEDDDEVETAKEQRNDTLIGKLPLICIKDLANHAAIFVRPRSRGCCCQWRSEFPGSVVGKRHGVHVEQRELDVGIGVDPGKSCLQIVDLAAEDAVHEGVDGGFEDRATECDIENYSEVDSACILSRGCSRLTIFDLVIEFFQSRIQPDSHSIQPRPK